MFVFGTTAAAAARCETTRADVPAPAGAIVMNTDATAIAAAPKILADRPMSSPPCKKSDSGSDATLRAVSDRGKKDCESPVTGASLDLEPERHPERPSGLFDEVGDETR